MPSHLKGCVEQYWCLRLLLHGDLLHSMYPCHVLVLGGIRQECYRTAYAAIRALRMSFPFWDALGFPIVTYLNSLFVISLFVRGELVHIRKGHF